MRTIIAKIPFALRFMIGFWLLLGLVDLLKGFVNAASYNYPFDWSKSLSFVSIYSVMWIAISYPIFVTFQRFADRPWLPAN